MLAVCTVFFQTVLLTHLQYALLLVQSDHSLEFSPIPNYLQATCRVADVNRSLDVAGASQSLTESFVVVLQAHCRPSDRNGGEKVRRPSRLWFAVPPAEWCLHVEIVWVVHGVSTSGGIAALYHGGNKWRKLLYRLVKQKQKINFLHRGTFHGTITHKLL